MNRSERMVLNEAAAEEFRRAADSPALRRDMQEARRLLESRLRLHPATTDDFLQFLTDFSEMCEGIPRRLRPMKDAHMALCSPPSPGRDDSEDEER